MTKLQKKAAQNEEEENALPPSPDANGKIVRIAFWIVSTCTVFFRVRPEQLLPTRESQEMLAGKRYDFSQEVIAETEDYFEGIDISEKCWNAYFVFVRDHVNE